MPQPAGIAYPPRDPGASSVDFADVLDLPGEDLLGVGADLRPGTLVAAYRHGLFPMGVGAHGRGPIGWWRPERRGVLLPGRLRVTRSLRASCRRYAVSVDRAFSEVVRACADPTRDGRWITDDVVDAYTELHHLGWAHSVEVWDGLPGEGQLVGGLYGVQVGGLFAGESMFHQARDASKVALVVLDALALPRTASDAGRVVDVQWLTPHLASLGVEEIAREGYRDVLADALEMAPRDLARLPLPAPWGAQV